ncbi:MAG: N-formylglutamate amidohydrolase [Xanthomonadales bacterium]|nr:N-formylglutamate amidohydrolase [Xanthomonadales bacterium]
MRFEPYAAPFQAIAGSREDLLVLCCHASHAIPDALGELGLTPVDRREHIAWDPGAREVALALATRLDCPALLGGVSRLVVDLNRSPTSSELILAESDNRMVPGNLRVSDAERAQRIADWHSPYHQAVDRHLDRLARSGIRPALVAVHSFTPVLCGRERPWPVGVLWKHDRQRVAALIGALQAQGLDVGDNEPYDGHVAMGYTLEQHGERRGLRHVLLELRNDLLGTLEQTDAWANRLAAALAEAGWR